METEKAGREALSVGQVAKRWGIGAERVRQIIDAGYLPEAFVIPSAGRYGETVKVPLSGVMAAEERWRVMPATEPPLRPRSRQPDDAPLRHFPELNLEPASEFPEDERR